MKYYVMAIGVVALLGGCANQPSFDKESANCSSGLKGLAPYSLELLEREYICKEQGESR